MILFDQFDVGGNYSYFIAILWVPVFSGIWHEKTTGTTVLKNLDVRVNSIYPKITSKEEILTKRKFGGFGGISLNPPN